MPTFFFGDLWTAKTDIIAVTTNAYVRRDDALVMGRGAAKQAITKYPALQFAAGAFIKRTVGSGKYYGWFVCSSGGKRIGLFQVKYRYDEDATLELIARSVDALCDWLTRHPDTTVALNYPGIGNGHLAIDDVAPLLAKLPDCVHIYRPR